MTDLEATSDNEQSYQLSIRRTKIEDRLLEQSHQNYKKINASMQVEHLNRDSYDRQYVISLLKMILKKVETCPSHDLAFTLKTSLRQLLAMVEVDNS